MENNLFSNYSLPQKKRGSKRADIIKDIYSLYVEDKLGRKKENWKRYIKYLKHYHLADTPKERSIFKKTRGTGGFIPEHKIGSFCFLISHIKTDDLFIILSNAKDMRHREMNYGGYIASHFSKGVIK